MMLASGGGGQVTAEAEAQLEVMARAARRRGHQILAPLPMPGTSEQAGPRWISDTLRPALAQHNAPFRKQLTPEHPWPALYPRLADPPAVMHSGLGRHWLVNFAVAKYGPHRHVVGDELVLRPSGLAVAAAGGAGAGTRSPPGEYPDACPCPAGVQYGVISVPREPARGRNDRMTIHQWPGRDALPPVQKWSASEPRQLYRNRRITVEEVQVNTGTGAPFPHQVIRFAADSVAAVVHAQGHGVLMLYRHRFITDRAGLALPAGGIEPGEDPVDAAVREVFEETGCKLQDARLLGSADVLPGVADKRFWFVCGTAEAGDDVPEPADVHESTALYWVPVSELFGLMTAGLISAQPSMLALLYADRAGLLKELPQ